ncbi:GNAT family N-acetyltransferase [Microbacterium stercoris]|uniref:GNAT family N-acetyltransferase n=1 Tax=Microbacterium stercoris TaxID=2820289 RepID=A0A939TLH6_9MICO|nr:GNAT family N-acetyltransferase [Microbacterium stercoris]MBO3662128.1 GNAT family N-acetyltransferase [Microbacterium stercoris]
MTWSLRRSTAADAAWIAELRAAVMRADLERLGVFDAGRVRERFLGAFEPKDTRVIVVDGRDAGSIALRSADDGWWIEHFYLRSDLQGRGIGSAVFATILAEVPAGDPIRINVLQGSPARGLYDRHGFVSERQDPVDVFLVRVARATEAPRRTTSR